MIKKMIVCHEDDVAASKVIGELAVLLAEGEGGYRWTKERGCKVGYPSVSTMPHLIFGGPEGFRIAGAFPLFGKSIEDGALVATYDPAKHRAFEGRRPRNLFSLFTIEGKDGAPEVEGFRSVVFLRAGAEAKRLIPAAVRQIRHVFCTERRTERFKNCGVVTVGELTAPATSRRRGSYLQEDCATP